jgi:hypothetical protein
VETILALAQRVEHGARLERFHHQRNMVNQQQQQTMRDGSGKRPTKPEKP